MSFRERLKTDVMNNVIFCEIRHWSQNLRPSRISPYLEETGFGLESES